MAEISVAVRGKQIERVQRVVGGVKVRLHVAAGIKRARGRVQQPVAE